MCHQKQGDDRKCIMHKALHACGSVCQVMFLFPGHGVNFLFPIQAKTFDYVYDGEDVIAQARKYACM